MFRSKRRSDCRTVALIPQHFVVLALHVIVTLVFVGGVSAGPVTNVTIDDSDVSFAEYAPSEAWHASTVPCSTCLSPPSSDAFMGTWHDGSHIVPTLDADDFPNGDGNSTTSSSSTSTVSGQSTSTSPGPSTTSPPPSSSPTSSSPPASTSPVNPNDPDAGPNDPDASDPNPDDHDKGKGHHDGDKRRRRSIGEIMAQRDVSGNPFFTQGNDSDDDGFEDQNVTATFTFNGTAIYLFAIVPQFPAPANTTPTWMELDFTLDSQSFGRFISQPGSVNGAASNISSSDSSSATSPQYIPHVPVFQASGLEDKQHTLIVNVAPDTVFLFDYAIITQTKADAESNLGNADVEAANRKHDIDTFVGAILGSVGFLSIVSLGVCISIRTRRRRSAARERRQASTYAERFTAHDHGATDMDEEDGGGMVSPGIRNPNSGFIRGMGVQTQPAMSQAAPTPFVPRYFPGTLTSPPPYIPPPESSEDDALMTNSSSTDLSRTTVSSHRPMAVAIPPPMLDLERVTTGSSYADRPPPTPPDVGPPVFGEPASEAHPVRMNPVLSLILSRSRSSSINDVPPPDIEAPSIPIPVSLPLSSTRYTGSTESLPRLSPSPSLADIRSSNPIHVPTLQPQRSLPIVLSSTPSERSPSSNVADSRSSQSPPGSNLIEDVPGRRP